MYPHRGLATAAEPYDVVVIGGGLSVIFAYRYLPDSTCFRKVREDT